MKDLKVSRTLLAAKLSEPTKPAECTGLGPMDVTTPYILLWLGAISVTKPCDFIRFGPMDVTKPSKFIGFGALLLGQARSLRGPRRAPGVPGTAPARKIAQVAPKIRPGDQF